MEIKEKLNLEVTVDKRHIVSIGERLYAESVELIRELVNNAYDADATEVHVEIKPDRIIVRDNGTGMDLEGLKQYFIIGSDEKVIQLITQEISMMKETKSPRVAFNRQSKLLKDAFVED